MEKLTLGLPEMMRSAAVEFFCVSPAVAFVTFNHRQQGTIMCIQRYYTELELRSIDKATNYLVQFSVPGIKEELRCHWALTFRTDPGSACCCSLCLSAVLRLWYMLDGEVAQYNRTA